MEAFLFLRSHGYNSESREYSGEVHYKYIMGQKFADYMHSLKADGMLTRKKILSI